MKTDIFIKERIN